MRDTISQLCNLMVHTKASTCMRIWSNLRSAGHGGDDMHANLANPELLDCLTVQSDTKAENLVLRSTVVARFSSVVRAVRRRTAAPQPAHTRLRGSSTHARERRTTAAAPNASLARPLSRAIARLARVAGALSRSVRRRRWRHTFDRRRPLLQPRARRTPPHRRTTARAHAAARLFHPRL